ncbi:1055_t:CDS:2 [Scutellospora calospora]|uniref:1055_t:CDS:1 n=1 Tax=Scutellospora calospora TaxID=85575 RepID=A0ACA9K2R2_9GLOM|nr:1055_t:CDS:2 [Scutellospora calospora]
MCGFGDKDRRPIDPPPVIKLLVSTTDGTPVLGSSIDNSTMVVLAGLWSENRREERSLVINPSSIPVEQSSGPSSGIMTLNAPLSTRNLMGHCTSSAYLLNDHTNQLGIFFIFQDLSVRTEGSFTLKFSFCDVRELMQQSQNGFTSTDIHGNVAAEVYSSSFRVYSAKKFPGMTESTALSKAFATQGIKIPIRKEVRYQKANEDLLNQTNESTTSSVTYNVSNNASKGNDHESYTEEDRELSGNGTDVFFDTAQEKEKISLKWHGKSN